MSRGSPLSRRTLRACRTIIGRLSLALQDISRQIGEGQRTDWRTFIAAVGLTVIIIGALGSAFVSPISVQLATLSERATEDRTHLDRKNAEIHALEREGQGRYAEGTEKFRKVETQLAWLRDVGNQRQRNNERLQGVALAAGVR